MKTVTLSTGVPGLDRILYGGLVFGAVEHRATGAVLIRGGAGTGKTLLASLLASRAAAIGGERACSLYALVEQAPSDVVHFVSQFASGLSTEFVAGRDIDLVFEKRNTGSPYCVVDGIDPESLELTDGAATSAIRHQFQGWLRSAQQRGRVPVCCVLDCIVQGSPLLQSLDRLAFQDLARFGTDQGMLMVIVEEEGAGPDWLPFACDVVIRLLPAQTDVTSETPMRRLIVEKSRFSRFVEGSHLYEIVAPAGLVLYPSLSSYRNAEPQSVAPSPWPGEDFGWEPIDQHAREYGKAVRSGSMTLISGDSQILVDKIADRFRRFLPGNDPGFAVQVAIHPAGIWLYRGQDEDRIVVGDFGTPPEKFLQLMLNLLSGWEKQQGARIRRAVIGNVFSLEGFPAAAFERYLQAVQILARHLIRKGASVAIAAAPRLPRNASFHEIQSLQIRVERSGATYDFSSPRCRLVNMPFTPDSLDLSPPAKLQSQTPE